MNKLTRRITRNPISIILILFFFTSCANYVELPVKVPADRDLGNIRVMAIGNIDLYQYPSLNLTENSGRWSVKTATPFSKEQSQLFREALIANLSKVAPYKVIDLKSYNTTQGRAFKSLRPVTGTKLSQVDALLSGSVVLQVVRQKGNEQRVRSFSHTKTVKSGKVWRRVIDTRTDKVVTHPYQSETASLVAHIELVETSNGAIQVKRAFSIPLVQSSIIGGGIPDFAQTKRSSKGSPEETMPLWKLDHQIYSDAPIEEKQLANQLAVKIVNSLLPRVSSYIQKEDRELASGGDIIAVNYIKAGALYHARKRLEDLIGTEDGKTGDNLYHLGICYEFLGEFPIAYQYYEEALKTSTSSDLYMKALGRTEKLIALQRK